MYFYKIVCYIWFELWEYYWILCMLENLKGRQHLEDVGVDGRVMLKYTVQTYILNTELNWIKRVVHSCIHGNEFTGYINGWQFLTSFSRRNQLYGAGWFETDVKLSDPHFEHASCSVPVRMDWITIIVTLLGYKQVDCSASHIQSSLQLIISCNSKHAFGLS